MLAVITCARKVGDAEQLFASVPGEFVPIEVAGASSIADGYNLGIEHARKAGADVCLFTHTDVQLLCSRQVLDSALRLTRLPGTGFVGVAGTHFLGADGVWWSKQEAGLGAVTHRTADHGMYTSIFGQGRYGRAVAMDGVFLMCRTSFVSELDAGGWLSFGDWHFYDIPMTVRASKRGYANWVLPIPVVHGSVGELGDAWLEARARYVSRGMHGLPYGVVADYDLRWY